MSRVLVIGSHTEVGREIGGALAAATLPMEFSAGYADALQRLRMRSFGVVITSPDSSVDEDLALLEEIRLIRPGVKCIMLAQSSTPNEVIAALRARVFACFTPPFDTYDIAARVGVEVEHPPARVLGRAPPPALPERHRPEPQLRDPQTAAAEQCVAHG